MRPAPPSKRPAKRKAAPAPAPRARDAAATRAAILEAARTAFAQHGYDGVGVRAIAGAAGVTAALVNRYFGSKQRLFSEVALADRGFADLLVPLPARGPAPRARVLARAFVGRSAQRLAADTERQTLLAILHSPGSAEAGVLVREWVEGRFVRPLAAWLGGPDAGARASLIVATIVGHSLLREVVSAPTLAQIPEEALAAWLESMLAPLVDPPPAKGRG